jgi:NADPH:quinone reductase-like Zn-dependent oxidoreductase
MQQAPQHFKACRTFQEDGVVRSRFVEMAPADLDPGDVLVRTKYSTINYKDALSYNGTGRIMLKYPTVAGIDMAGTVETSADPRFRHGDKVIENAYDGCRPRWRLFRVRSRAGGRVVRRSPDMTAFEAMTLWDRGVIPPPSRSN